MALTLEDIKKLPPKERIPALRKFEEEQKKLKEEERERLEEEENNQKKEAEALIKRSIDEITLDEEKQLEEEEEKLKEDEKKKKESLEEIAKEAKPPEKKDDGRELAYQTSKAQQMAYGAALAKEPISTIYGSVRELKTTIEERGYLTQQEVDRARTLGDAVYQKQKANYDPNERARQLMNKTQEILDDVLNKTRTYR